MTSGSTRELMALCAIAQHFGRPGTPTDQPWIESFNGHLKTENPHLLAITDPATPRAELVGIREHYNTVRLHEGIGYVTPRRRARRPRRHHPPSPAVTASNKLANDALPPNVKHETLRPPRTPTMWRNQPRSASLTQTHLNGEDLRGV